MRDGTRLGYFVREKQAHTTQLSLVLRAIIRIGKLLHELTQFVDVVQKRREVRVGALAICGSKYKV